MFKLRPLVRSIARRPGSSALLVGLCALGVALSTTIFAVVDSVLLDPLPYPDSHRLVKPWCVAEAFGIDTYPFSWDNYRDYRDQVHALEDLAATRGLPLTLDGGDRPVSVRGTRVTANLFRVLRVEPVLGRVFEETADGAPEEAVALIGHGLWQNLFGATPDVLGRTIRLDGKPHAIIGVLPPTMRYPRNDSQVFIPLVIGDGPESRRAFHFLRVVGRLRDGSTLDEARAEMNTLAKHLAETYPQATGNLTTRISTLKEELVGTSRRSLTTLFSAVQVLFCIAWANIAILLLARGMARQGELRLRAALGANRTRLFVMLLAEAGILAGAGCLLGLGLGWLSVSSLPQIDPTLLPRAFDIRFSPSLVLWALALTVGGAVLFGGLPAWAATRGRGTGLTSARSTDWRTSKLNRRLVAAQVTLALPLLVASSMQLRSVRALAAVDTGFRTVEALAAGVALPLNQFGPPEQKLYVDRAVEALGRLPGVHSVGAISHLPLSRRAASIVTYRPDQAGETTGLPNAHYRVISPGLLSTLGIPLVEGREFEVRDEENERPIVIIDQKLARALYPDRSAVGQKVRMGSDTTDWEVIGVARPAQLLSLDEEPTYTIYVPILHNKFAAAMSTPRFVLHTGPSPASLAPAARRTLQEVDREQAILDVRPLASQLDDWLGTRRAVAWLLWAIAGAALLLASAGIYATLAFAVARRRREMAIRSALGAAPRRLARSVVADGLKPGAAGAAVGLIVCLAVGRAFVGNLYGVNGIDLPSLATAMAILLAAALVACAAPARRATRENPARLLRDDGTG